MKALIFAAGLGTRLKPLTNTTPKAMIPVCGKPLLEHVICKLIKAGTTEIVVNVHHFAEQIIDFIEQKNYFGITIHISDERDELLETGGGIKKATSLFSKSSEPFLIHNVDILSNINLTEFYLGNKDNANATLLVSNRKTSRYLLFNPKNNRLMGWTNLQTGEIKSPYPDIKIEECVAYAFSGIHLFSPSLLPYMEEWQGRFSVIDFYLSIAHKVPIFAAPYFDLELIDVGKLDTLKRAEEFLRE